MNKLSWNDLIASVHLGGVLCLAVLCGVLAAGSSAQTNSTWTDATGNWSNAGNWNNGVPNGNFNALISNGNPGVATVNLDINATIANLELDTQNTLNIEAGKTLTFQSSSGSTAAGGGTINVASGATILVAGGGSLATFSDTLTSTNINMLGANSLITGATGAEKMTLLAELHPDLIILDVHLAERESIAPTKVKGLLNGAKIIAITLGADDVKEELLHGIGAAKLVDKMDLSDQLIPAILELAPVSSS